MTVKKNYKVIMGRKAGQDFELSFEHEGKVYKTGETWRKPDDWELDSRYMDEFSGGRPTFRYVEEVGYELVDNVKQPLVVERRVILPVE